MQTYHQEDDIIDKQYDLSLTKRLLVFAKPYKGLASLVIALTLMLTVLGVAIGPRLQGLALNELVPETEFSANEFSDNFSVKNLCDALRKDNFVIPHDTVDELNNLLKEKETKSRDLTNGKLFELVRLLRGRRRRILHASAGNDHSRSPDRTGPFLYNHTSGLWCS